MYVCMYVCIYLSIYLSMYACMYVCMNVCIHALREHIGSVCACNSSLSKAFRLCICPPAHKRTHRNLLLAHDGEEASFDCVQLKPDVVRELMILRQHHLAYKHHISAPHILGKIERESVFMHG